MNQTQKMAILEKLISFKSVNDHEKQVAKYLQELLKDADIDSTLVPVEGDRANLVAEIGSGKPILGITGHMDVVDVELDNWQTDPFRLTAKGDKLYGRGSTDMKAGLAAMVIAMIELKQNQTPFNGTIRLMATAGEEVGQQGAKVLFDQGYMQDVDTLLVGEPSGYLAPYASKGELDIHINSVGKAAHSSMPQFGNNAVEHLIDVLNQIKQAVNDLMADVHNDVLGDTVFNIDVIHGGSQDNAIPGSANAVLNIRTIPELTNQKILETIQSVIDQYNASTTGQISMDVNMDIIPIVGKADAQIIKLVQQVAAPYAKDYYTNTLSAADLEQKKKQSSMIGVEFAPDQIMAVGIAGGTDASRLLFDKPTGANYVMFGPGNDNPHQDNEYVSQTMFLQFIEIYKELFTEFLK
ncbi:ArgE/DapE family deacylase [Bombilactobacillus folatiphilus]|uniref:Probable succinyl-diaminopimelate desuccinylase n=1 Tax=Bombilactobacillus folatiphilus TaxID=2923362 RepID=A0ABY4P7H5_9LACO|nr:ArgE/DapE family deacylase [Bombilactobacillus folatiphilus]UQS81486.1 ArgE/DapE family deacylase [Bombilactobacillus folatiphilus]